MKMGITTGACAALAAKAAVSLLVADEELYQVDIPLPDGSRLECALAYLKRTADGAEAAVIKDAGDDPDITHGATIAVEARLNGTTQIRFYAGEGVGTVTRPGLAMPVGEPAINPGPRRLIAASVAEVTSEGVDITVSIPGGMELAQKTFNPRLGIEGGLSVLGTSGRVRPFSSDALQESLKCSFSVAEAAGVTRPVLVPGHIGNKSARTHFNLGELQVVEVSNEWGFMLDNSRKHSFEAMMALGHPGKLAKLAEGQWQTHSSKSPSAVPYVSGLAEEVLGHPIEEAITIEGLFMALPQNDRKAVGDALASRIHAAITDRLAPAPELAVVLINLKGEILGSDGNVQLWS